MFETTLPKEQDFALFVDHPVYSLLPTKMNKNGMVIKHCKY